VQPTAIVLTFNIELARSLGATVVERPFENYGAQRNWAIDNLPISRPWQLHPDADEWMNDRLVAAIQARRIVQNTSVIFYPGIYVSSAAYCAMEG
jgi:hypothetical protein